MKNVAMAVVIKNRKVLIQERFRRSKGMVFEFPGGTMDSGETPEQAAARELWEETGLKNVEVIGWHEGINDFGSKIYFVVFSASGEAGPQIVDSARRQTFHWLDAQDIPRKDLYQADIDFIDKHLSRYV